MLVLQVVIPTSIDMKALMHETDARFEERCR